MDRADTSSNAASFSGPSIASCRSEKVKIGEYSTAHIEVRTLSLAARLRKFAKEHLFLLLTLAGVIAGVVLGLGLRHASPSESTIVLIGMPGEVFMRSLRMLVLPMMIASIITGLIVFCVVFGGALGTLGQPVEILKQFFAALDAAIMKIVYIVMWMTPVGVMSLLCARILSVASIVTLFQQMALLVGTVLSGLAVELFVVECLLYFVVTRKNPFKFLGELAYVAVCAFVTAASAPVMPLSLKCLEENCGIDRRVTRFVVPIGVTVNMNGTAVFITVSSIFIAQLNGIVLTSGDYFAIVISATAVSVASTSVPSSALFLMVMTLSVIGAPVSDVSLLFTVEWLLDRARTTNNCLGDCFTCALVDHICFRKKTSELSEVVIVHDEASEKLQDSAL
ncbi:hypothetical protein HPB52_019652 [Rhipicephalus sanguineus]|uniref:Amino acid transporter n=1 Tax=Rhipicephalus sanguineus TaxID=34632 RepID=A0A9D4Q318_RHISA|nr:hypothetical protein HPB52_019652 [Rhipicephalus sanguineus]